MLRSACGMPGGTVRMTFCNWRGVREWPWRDRWAGLLICESACVSTSASMKVMSELREYCGMNACRRSSAGKLYSASPVSLIKCEDGAAVAYGSFSDLTYAQLNRQPCP
ncbi:hypothetical protein G6F57_021798 [Rhizopus arrhizus]|nr:hypothetical protein G6F57_021798 [Rhizopus arrhizus]